MTLEKTKEKNNEEVKPNHQNASDLKNNKATKDAGLKKPYQLKISKNCIKLKNIETLFPNNIGVEETANNFVLSYKNEKLAEKDLKKNEKEKYHNNKIIITNFSYKEDEETIKEFLKPFGEVVDLILEKNKENIFTGKAVVTFANTVKLSKELKLNNKILRVERIKKVEVNDKRIFIGRINQKLSILEIRNALKSAGCKPEDIRIRFEKETKKNIGYGHLTFKTRQDALKFEESFKSLKECFGEHAFYEYAKEKNVVGKNKKR